MEKAENEMGTMNITKLAFKISIPMVLSMISIALYGIVDTMFISKIGSDALTAVSLTIPYQAIITAIALGTGIGLNSFLAKTLGEKNNIKINKIIQHGFVLTFISYLCIFFFSILIAKRFFYLFTSNSSIQELGYQYLIILSIGSIGTLYQILFEKILESYGKTKDSMIVKFSGVIINFILDPILIFGLLNFPKLGIRGAAISTIIGQFFGMTVGLILLKKSKIISIKDLGKIKLEKNILVDIYKVAFPTIILETVTSFITLILNRILGKYSDNAILVWGIYSQIQKFVMIIIYGFNYGMIPIIAYNWGAKNKDRIQECIKCFLNITFFVTLIGMLVFIFIPKQLISIFNVSTEIYNIAIPAFRILSISFIFSGICLVFGAIFQAFGNGLFSLIVNMSRQVILPLIFIFVLKKYLNLNGIWLSFTIASIITMLISIGLYKYIKKNIINQISNSKEKIMN